jgi:hypothetical protein
VIEKVYFEEYEKKKPVPVYVVTHRENVPSG